jgi:putative transposase
MPRKQRFYIPNIPAHVMQRGHNRDAVFFSEQDYFEYLKILKRVSESSGCAIHAYVLMR